MQKKARKEKAAPVTIWKREPGWEKMSKEDMAEMLAYNSDYIEFLSAAKTERLAHDMALEKAKAAGFRNIEKTALASGNLLTSHFAG